MFTVQALKVGPSGTAITIAIISLLTNTKILNNAALMVN